MLLLSDKVKAVFGILKLGKKSVYLGIWNDNVNCKILKFAMNGVYHVIELVAFQTVRL